MRKFLVLSFCFLMFGFSSCVESKTNVGEKVITVSILPQKYFVERIAGKDFNINVLIPPGASPATYEPTPVQMKNISHSLIYFRIGHIPFEEAWMDKLTAGSEELKVVDLSEGVQLIHGPEMSHGDHSHEGGIDPHIWTSPKVVKQLTGKILEELILLAPEKKDEYQKNYEAFVKDLDALNVDAQSAFEDLKNRSFMIYHPAMSYFAQDFDLRQVPIELEGKDPSPSHLKHIIADAKEMGIKVVFVQKQFSTENAQAIAREIDGQVETIDPLSEDWLKEMYRIVEIFKASMNH